MKERSPTWYLNSGCPGCGQSTLVLCACPDCAHVAARCDACDGHDLKTIFYLDPKDLSAAERENLESIRCRSCANRMLPSFIEATSEQIKDAGFNAGEFR